VSPGTFPFPEIGIQKVTAVIVDRGDQIPLGLGLGSPEVNGGVVLNQFADIVRQDFPVVRFSEKPFLVMPSFFARRMMVGNETKILCFFSRTSFR